jgi:hypothetical protein
MSNVVGRRGIDFLLFILRREIETSKCVDTYHKPLVTEASSCSPSVVLLILFIHAVQPPRRGVRFVSDSFRERGKAETAYLAEHGKRRAG